MMKQLKRRPRGFTLPELMIVVVLAGIMVGIGVPSFQSFVAGQRVKTAAGEYATALVLARSEAIKRNKDVYVLPATLATSGWSDGWTVWVDTNSNTSLDAPDEVIATQPAYTGLSFTGPSTSVTYKSTGRLSAAVVTMQVESSVSSVDKRCVAIALSGLPNTTITKGTCP